MSQQIFGDIRSVVQQTPSAARWKRLCALMEMSSDHELTERVVPYVLSHLDAWPDAMRTCPAHWLNQLALGEDDHPGLRCVRAVRHERATPEVVRGIVSSAHLIHPRHIELSGELRDEDVAMLLHHERLGEVRRLDLSHNLLTDHSARALARAESARALTALSLDDNRIGTQGAQEVLMSPHLIGLVELGLGENLPGEEGARALYRRMFTRPDGHRTLKTLRLGGRSERGGSSGGIGWGGLSYILHGEAHTTSRPQKVFEYIEELSLAANLHGAADAYSNAIRSTPPLELAQQMPAVHTLDLCANQLGPDHLSTLLAGGLPEHLSTLDLSVNRLGDQGARALADTLGPHGLPASLTSLRLAHAMLGGASLEHMTEAQWWTGLEELVLSGNPFARSHALRALLDAEPGALRALALGQCRLEYADTYALARAECLRQLERLILYANEFDDRSLTLLATSYTLTQLKLLDLSSNPFTDRGVRALAGGALCQGLEELSLQDTATSDEGVRALVSHGVLDGMKRLSLARTEVGDEAALAIAECPSARALEHLDLYAPRVTERGRRALFASTHLSEALRRRFEPAA
ncbi:MAG: hypothetical protein AAGI01_13570 [Myxococcota bacterium]